MHRPSLSMDDLLAMTCEFINPAVSRSGLDRCLQQHGVSNLQALTTQPEDEDQPQKILKGYEPGFIHADVKYLPQMPDETAHRYLFVGIDRASRWVYVEILGEKTAANATAIFRRLIAQVPFTVQKILTDNGKKCIDRFCVTCERDPTGRHRFERTCPQHGIDHRHQAPSTPDQRDGRVLQ